MKTYTIPLILMIMLVFMGATTGVFATKYSIDVENFSFSPSSITTVRIGDTIHWVWINGNHTTTSVTIPAGAAAWDSPLNSTNTSFNYIPLVEGTYDYRCSIHFSMGMVGSFVVSSPAAVDNPLSTVTFQLYPNPFTEKVTLVFRGENGSSVETMKIYDATGNLLTDRIFNTGQTIESRELLLSSLPSGVLFFEVRDSKGNIYVRRLIKR